MRRIGFAPLHEYAYPVVLDGIIFLVSLLLLLKLNRSNVYLFLSPFLIGGIQATILSSLASSLSAVFIIFALPFDVELSLSLRSSPSQSIAFSLLLIQASHLSPSLSGTRHTVTHFCHPFPRSLVLASSLLLPSLQPIASLFGFSHFSGLFSLPLLLSQIPVFCSLGVTLTVPSEDSEHSIPSSRILSVFSFLASS